MNFTVFMIFIQLVTSINIFIGRETEITSHKTILIGRLKISVTAKETLGKRGFVVITKLDNQWKIKWTNCTEEVRSKVCTVDYHYKTYFN